MARRDGEALTHVPQMLLADHFAINAALDDVLMAEDIVRDEIGPAGILNTDPLTIRCKARYLVAERLIQVRDERP